MQVLCQIIFLMFNKVSLVELLEKYTFFLLFCKTICYSVIKYSGGENISFYYNIMEL